MGTGTTAPRAVIRYRDGYLYQLAEDCAVATGLRVSEPISTRYLRLDVDGTLTIREGYAWDGPSGPTIDTPSAMRGSLVHDALYQLIRERRLAADIRKQADEIYHRLCVEDGMSRFRAWAHFTALRGFGAYAADPDHDRPILEAP